MAAYLKFETGGKISLYEIEKDSQKYERCKKALNEKNHKRDDGEPRIILEAAFKIENKRMLSVFDEKRENVQELLGPDQVLLKGLFIKIKKP